MRASSGSAPPRGLHRRRVTRAASFTPAALRARNLPAGRPLSYDIPEAPREVERGAAQRRSLRGRCVRRRHVAACTGLPLRARGQERACQLVPPSRARPHCRLGRRSVSRRNRQSPALRLEHRRPCFRRRSSHRARRGSFSHVPLEGRGSDLQCGTVLRHPAALVQAAKGKVAASVGSIAIGGMVCSSLTLAGVLYPCRATSQVSL